MSINATLFAQMVVFALLVWFTMKFVWPVLQKAMQDRETKIADGLAAAERGKHELELAEQRSLQLLREGKDKAQEYVAQAQRRADEIVEEAKAAARVEGERLVTAARAQIDQERIQAREELRKEVASLAIAAAEQVLAREVNPKVHAETLERFSAQL